VKMFDAGKNRMIGLPYGEKNYDNMLRKSFLRASAMLKHVIAIGLTSVRPSVRPSVRQSVRPSVCLSVRHTLAPYQNG